MSIINEKLTDALINGISTLSDTVKNIAPKVWEVYLKQQIVIGVELIIAGFLMISIGGFLLYKLRKYYKSDDYDGDDFEHFLILGYMFLPIIIGVGLLLIGSSIGHFINPEYYVIQKLITATIGVMP